VKPSTLQVRSFAKVNLALAVLGRRADGYHEIRTVYQSVDLHDMLIFRASSTLQLDCTGLKGVSTGDNLVWKAAHALARASGPGRGAHITLRKNIPPGSGLGGGSSNAAAALLGLRRFWNLEVSDQELWPLGGELGSDIPFFLRGGTALGIGRGEEIYPLPEPQPMNLVIVYPGVQISTADAYKSLSLGLTSSQGVHKIQGFCSRLQSSSEWPAEIFNDFEVSILPAHPAIGEAKGFLNQSGATASLMSGSGSSVFGLFLDEESALAASRAVRRRAWRVFPAKTLSRTEYLHRMFG